MCKIRKVLLAGATGFIGRALDGQLQQAGYVVNPLARSLGQDYNQMLSAADWMPYLDGIDAVINAIGIIGESHQQRFGILHHQGPAALFAASADAGVQRVIQISALGADEQAFTPYQLSKRAADDYLRTLSLDWFVLRPSLVYGEASRSLKLFRRLARLPVLPLPDGGVQQVQPIHLDDLTDCVLKCLSSERVNLTLDLVGPRPIRFVDWLSFLRCQQGGGRTRVLDVSPTLAVKVAQLVHHVLPLAHPDNLWMLQQGNVADAQPLTQFLGHPPVDVTSLS